MLTHSFKVIKKHLQPIHALVPVALIEKEKEEGKRKVKAWKRGRYYRDPNEVAAGLIEAFRVRVDVSVRTRYTDTETGLYIEDEKGWPANLRQPGDMQRWSELSALVREKRPDTFEDDTDDDETTLSTESTGRESASNAPEDRRIGEVREGTQDSHESDISEMGNESGDNDGGSRDGEAE
jgi:hypothetical protein